MEKFFNIKLIEDFKEKHNLSTSAFCKLCGISLSTYKRVLSHDKNLPLRFAIKITDVLNISLSEFIKN